MAPPRADRYDMRAFRPIEAMRYRIRTFHGPSLNRDAIAQLVNGRPTSHPKTAGDFRQTTVDQIVFVTLPLLRCVWPDAVSCRRVML